MSKLGQAIERWLEHIHQDIEYEAVELVEDYDQSDDTSSKHGRWLEG